MIKNFKFLRYLKVQVSLYFLITSLLIIAILGSIMYFSISNVILQDELDSTRDSVERSGRYVELYMDKVKTLSSIIAKDEEIRGYLSGGEGIDRESLMDRIGDVLSTDKFLLSVIIAGKDGAVISNEKELDMTVCLWRWNACSHLHKDAGIFNGQGQLGAVNQQGDCG